MDASGAPMNMKRFPFNYNFGETELQVRVGNWTIRRIRYSDIEDLNEGCPPWNEHWTNFWPVRYITVRRKTGLIKNFVVSPPDPMKFIDELKLRIAPLRMDRQER